MDDIPNSSGIYKITCIVSKKIYVGSAINLRTRKSHHFGELQRNRHCNPKLQNAWNKYGEQAFTFEVLELVLPMSLTAREQYWFNKLKPFGNKGFNIAREAGSQLGLKHTSEAREKNRQAHLGVKQSPEAIEKSRQARIGMKHTSGTIEKMRQSKIGHEVSDEARKKISQANLGRKDSLARIEEKRQIMLGNKHALGSKGRLGQEFSPETIEKMRQNRLGKKHTPESKEKIRQASLGKKWTPEQLEERRQAKQGMKTYIVTSPDGTECIVTGMNQFCRDHDLNPSHLVAVSKGKRNHHKGWRAINATQARSLQGKSVLDQLS